LARAGFRQELRDWLPTALALADSGGREVDLHPVSPTPDGGGDQRLPNGDTFHYPSPVRGSVGGREVWCVDVDMDRLRDRFGITLPDTYA
jgi:lincosamide nucleotidyltransferase A/C/D/E